MVARVTLVLLLAAIAPGRPARAGDHCPELRASKLAPYGQTAWKDVPGGGRAWTTDSSEISGCPYLTLPVEAGRTPLGDVFPFAAHVAGVLRGLDGATTERRYEAAVDGPQPYANALVAALQPPGGGGEIVALEVPLRSDDRHLVVALQPVGPVSAQPPDDSWGGGGAGDGGGLVPEPAPRAMSPLEIAPGLGPGYDLHHWIGALELAAAYAPPRLGWFAIAASASVGFTQHVYVTRWEYTNTVCRLDLAARFGMSRDWPASLQGDVGLFVQPGISAGLWPGLGLRLRAPVEFWIHVPIHLAGPQLGTAGVYFSFRIRFGVPKHQPLPAALAAERARNLHAL